MNKNNINFSETDSSSSSENEAETRVRNLMDKIFKKGDGLKTDDDINRMVDQCAGMLDKMKIKTNQDKVAKSKQQNRRGAGDQASPKMSPKTKSKVSSKTSPDALMEQLIQSAKGKDLFKDKRNKPSFGEIYKERLAETFKPEAPPSKKDIKDMLGKSGDHSWRQKIEKLMEGSSASSKSSETSSEEEEGSEASEEEKLFQKAMSSDLGKKQKNVSDRERKQFMPSKEDYEEAKKKAQDWLRARDPNQNWNKMTMEALSSEESEDDDVIPTRKSLQKKTEDNLMSLKAKLTGPAQQAASAKKSVFTAPTSSKTSALGKQAQPTSTLKKTLKQASPATKSTSKPTTLPTANRNFKKL